jgi:phospholipid/cholesterol/gamma-HCH transport system substrate-binding protein
MSQRSIEVKVGLLILVALGLLGAFIIIMGGLSFEPTYTVYVDFENPGGLQSGAPVRVAGVKVGRVSEMQFRGGQVDPKTKQAAPLVRVVAKIEEQYQNAIRNDARFFVTSQGVLGELYLAIEPGSAEAPVIRDGAVVQGVNPPRLDLLLSESYELLHRAYVGITKNEDKISDTFDGLHKTLKGTGDFFEKNDKKLDNVVSNVEKLSAEANETVRAARERYVDGPQVTRIMNNVERTTTKLDQNLGPMLTDGREVLSRTRKLTDTLASDAQLKRYERITQNVSETTERAKLAAADAQALISHVKRGKGTVGALVMDEALYDDLQEMLRDLKHNPWKFFWRQ